MVLLIEGYSGMYIYRSEVCDLTLKCIFLSQKQFSGDGGRAAGICLATPKLKLVFSYFYYIFSSLFLPFLISFPSIKQGSAALYTPGNMYIQYTCICACVLLYIFINIRLSKNVIV